MAASRAWEVLLIGGPSGAGKTQISYRLAHHFGAGITEVDDLQVMLARMTTPEQMPLLHYWDTHPEMRTWPPERIAEHLIAISRLMAPALEAVIANHLETHTPIVLEGDFILPGLAAQAAYANQPNGGRVRALFVDEPDEAQLAENFRLREPEAGEQRGRAAVSAAYGRWLRAEAGRAGAAVLPARPWADVFERALALLQ